MGEDSRFCASCGAPAPDDGAPVDDGAGAEDTDLAGRDAPEDVDATQVVARPETNEGADPLPATAVMPRPQADRSPTSAGPIAGETGYPQGDAVGKRRRGTVAALAVAAVLLLAAIGAGIWFMSSHASGGSDPKAAAEAGSSVTAEKEGAEADEPDEVLMPSLVGLDQAAAKKLLEGEGLALGSITTAASDDVPAGAIISHAPAAGSSVAKGSSAAVVVSTGPAAPHPNGDPVTPASPVTTGTYILPDSDTRVYSTDELAQFSDWDLMLARNEIYARHGRAFKDDDVRRYYESQAWYQVLYTADEFDAIANSVLSSTEQQNIANIKKVEDSR